MLSARVLTAYDDPTRRVILLTAQPRTAGEAGLPPATETHLYRVAQEALNNVYGTRRTERLTRETRRALAWRCVTVWRPGIS